MAQERPLRSIDDLPIAMTVAEVAGILRVCRTTVYELIRMSQATGGATGLQAVKLGRLAAQLGLAPSTAANALLQLRRRNLLRLEQRSGEAGRLGLAVYTLEPVPGLADVPFRLFPEPRPPASPRS